MKDQEVAGRYPVAGREESAELYFDALGIFGGCPGKALGQTSDMGIDDHRRDPEGGAKDDVGGLAADAGEGGQCGQGVRNLAVVAFL